MSKKGHNGVNNRYKSILENFGFTTEIRKLNGENRRKRMLAEKRKVK